ncbi:FadR/GntR family transcriptional regulator [Candidatus Cyanaurora vandensis]|uniref:FadR/GntR family transcriptional regulator n=1 Tax=Candidatus Cyanaurora vandensis TaxID=2714958 RepID=UPI002579BAA3|nr:FadR/GntR family transcriptional regulator [Candidatus Cyanaurora vandensis]
MKTPVQRQNLTAQVIQHFQERLALGEFPVGTKLPPESELMNQLGVGRSTLREAVRVLAHSGLLEVRQGDGTYVRARTTTAESLELRLQRAAIREVYEVRRLLELEMAGLAAQRRDEQDLARMQEQLHLRRLARAAGDDRAFLDADVAFHLAVATASKNAVLADLYQTFTTQLRLALNKLVADPDIQCGNQALHHHQLFEAIAAQDVAAAQSWTAQYLESIMGQLEQLPS